MDTVYKIIGGLIALVGGLALGCLILGLPVMLLWNGIMPELFGLKTVTFAQAIGLNLLSGFLFKGITISGSKLHANSRKTR